MVFSEPLINKYKASRQWRHPHENTDNAIPRGYSVQRRHGGERELHRQEDRDHHDEHHGGAVGVPLPPVPGLLIARLDPEYRESPERKSI